MPDEGRTPADVMIEQIENFLHEEYLRMAGRHGVPSTGDGKKAKGIKPKKSEISQVSKGGATNAKETAKLWGIFSGKKGRKKS